MINILPQSNAGCLEIHFSGKVTAPEYQQFLNTVRERLMANNQLNLVVEFAGFEFYGDFETAKQDLKFGFGEYKSIHRAAFVGDQKWIGWFTRFVGPFTRAEEMQFPADQLDDAVKWACG
jgi:SpoIIAA-like